MKIQIEFELEDIQETGTNIFRVIRTTKSGEIISFQVPYNCSASMLSEYCKADAYECYSADGWELTSSGKILGDFKE